MKVHSPSTHAEAEAFKLSELYNNLRTEISGLKGPEGLRADWGSGEATFGHLVGGYDAGYYGYLSSQVYSTDMFYSVFKKNPMDPRRVADIDTWCLRREEAEDEMKTLEDFLGRPPSSDAFYTELGLKAK